MLVIGATNRPQELDEAARRRFVKKLYIPLPDERGRGELLHTLLQKNANTLEESNVQSIVQRTAGFSGADLRNLCTEAAMGPIRDSVRSISSINEADLPPISSNHFELALSSVKPTVSESDLDAYISWNNDFGTFNVPPSEARATSARGSRGSAPPVFGS